MSCSPTRVAILVLPEATAREVGYEDPAFFSRLFRRNVSLTPAQYRKRFGALRSELGAR